MPPEPGIHLGYYCSYALFVENNNLAICQQHSICNQRYTDISDADLDAVNTRPGNLLSVTGHFSVKIDFTQFRKYRSVGSHQVKPISVEHLLYFRIRNELQFVKAQK